MNNNFLQKPNLKQPANCHIFPTTFSRTRTYTLLTYIHLFTVSYSPCVFKFLFTQFRFHDLSSQSLLHLLSPFLTVLHPGKILTRIRCHSLLISHLQCITEWEWKNTQKHATSSLSIYDYKPQLDPTFPMSLLSHSLELLFHTLSSPQTLNSSSSICIQSSHTGI